MRTTLIALAAAAVLSAAHAAAQPTSQGASQPYFRCDVTGRIANFVVSAGDLRQGVPPKLGDNQCAAPGASCQWSNGVLTLTEQANGKPLVRIFDTVKGVYTTRYNGQDKPSTCTKMTPGSSAQAPGPAPTAQSNATPSSG